MYHICTGAQRKGSAVEIEIEQKSTKRTKSRKTDPSSLRRRASNVDLSRSYIARCIDPGRDRRMECSCAASSNEERSSFSIIHEIELDLSSAMPLCQDSSASRAKRGDKFSNREVASKVSGPFRGQKGRGQDQLS